MAGIGIRLHRFYDKHTVTTQLAGMSFSVLVTIAPVVVIIGALFLMGNVLGMNQVGYAKRMLFSCTMLYIFIFSILCCAPFNAVLSRYLSDILYEERYDDVQPCFELGMLLTVLVGSVGSVPFCLWEYLVGGVPAYYVFTGFCGFVALELSFYAMLYLSITKSYMRISMIFISAMAISFVLSVIFVFQLHWEVCYSMLLAMVTGFWLVAGMEIGTVFHYFPGNSQRYVPLFCYMKKYWKLMVANLCYTLGLYVHNFVFWGTPIRMVVVKSFVCCQSYDVASCLAMFTNISASTIFITRVEMHFRPYYKDYTEAVIGGRWSDIQTAKSRMFRQISTELFSLVRVQFIISMITFLMLQIIMPLLGQGGLVMRIYPCLAAGYFCLFLMYAGIIFLFYFNDQNGVLLVAGSFLLVTFVGSMISRHFLDIFYGMGVGIGALFGWCMVYLRLRYMEQTMELHTFCKGELLPSSKEDYPAPLVYRKGEQI